MTDFIFIGGLALAYIGLLNWSCRILPKERWQIMCSIPVARNGSGAWRGLNITYYGFFQAGAFTAALTMMTVMLGALGFNTWETMALVIALLAVCVPASRWVARVVEKKPQTITVAGALFVGLLLCPLLVLAGDRLFGRPESTMLPVLAALGVCYALGKGLGRLACISFGCCYGKPLAECPPFFRRIFKERSFVFTGHTKKIAYAGGLEGQPVLPIQAITSAVYVFIALAGFLLFMQGWFIAAFLSTIGATQVWRGYSETLRADYRGGSRLTAYQRMALGAVAYSLILAWLAPAAGAEHPVLMNGLAGLWNPGLLIVLEAVWFSVLVYYGRSRTTGATIRFHVVRNEI